LSHQENQSNGIHIESINAKDNKIFTTNPR
jgi:hypothetical protein